MKLVLDANELIGVIIGKGRGWQTKRLDIFFSEKVGLFTPKVIIEELERNIEDVISKSGLSEDGIESFLESVEARVDKIPEKEYSLFLPEAEKICPHAKDVMYFAVALKLSCAVWSEEKRLKKQSKVPVFNTEELHKKLFEEKSGPTKEETSDK